MNQFKKSLVGFNILLLLADIFFYAKGKIRPFTFWALLVVIIFNIWLLTRPDKEGSSSDSN
ncbi:MAG: hypothetical protein GXO27_05645 [Chlorobi bacterium]|nr:hypothetical protein [Chlorobiota bacterium]